MMLLLNLDFADDPALLSHTQQQMQKTTSKAADLNIHKRKSKIFRYNATCTNQIALDGEAFEDVKTFTYLDSIIDEHSESDAVVFISHCSESSRDHTTVNSTKKRLQFRALCSGLRSHRSESECDPCFADPRLYVCIGSSFMLP
ncbi:unnamed protein product, partial [Schistosoma curassoni]|uniref:Ovule protein n=1 Tax=Schistosoma curassoni TaxID=6186 RepID=A0A183L0V2_9TREM